MGVRSQHVQDKVINTTMKTEASSKSPQSFGFKRGNGLARLQSSHRLLGWICLAVGGLAVAVAQPAQAVECPFCSAASQTLRQESLTMDVVAIGSLVSDGRLDIDGNATFVIERILRGESLLEKGQKIEANYFGPGKNDKKFLLLGVDPRNLVWSSPLPLSADAEKYVQALQSLPEDPVERLEFFQQYFEHPDSLLARDSYDEFALAPYEDVKKLKSKMHREQLMEWIRDPQISPDRKRLYYTMLGICGTEADAVEFESMIRSKDPDKRAGLDALIAAYLMLRGEAGLALIDEQFLGNRKASYPDVYSSVMALRFHGTESDRIPKEAILKSMRQLIEAPDLADLVIPDLARWGDWSQIERLTELFKKSNDDNSWVRVPVVNYLRACPLPEAKERLKELELIDPKAVKRASTFFPIPAPAAQPAKKDGAPTSSKMELPRSHGFGGVQQHVVEHRPGHAGGVPLRLTTDASHGWSLRDKGWETYSLHELETGANGVGSTQAALTAGGAVVARLPSGAAESHPSSLRDDPSFGMNSRTLISVIACGGIAFGAVMVMITGGLMSGRCAILGWLLRSDD